MKNMYFISNGNGEFEYWVDGKCITDCYNVKDSEDLLSLIHDLNVFGHVPIYKKIEIDEIQELENL